MNSEKHFMVAFWKATFLGFAPKYLEGMTWKDKGPFEGALQGWPPKGWGSMELHFPSHYALHVIHIAWAFWGFMFHPTPCIFL